MKDKLKELIRIALASAHRNGAIPVYELPEYVIEEPKHESQGDYAANIAMVSASIQKRAPKEIARAIVDHIHDKENILHKTEVAGPGFINFFLKPVAWKSRLEWIRHQDKDFGKCDFGRGEKIQVEFVSSNPTGPLHVGHGRGAAFGDALASVLSSIGYAVEREYYVNDAGNQIRTLGKSVYARLMEKLDPDNAPPFPEDAYQGRYIRDIAQNIFEKAGEKIQQMDPETAILECAEFAVPVILEEMKTDLLDFGVSFDIWFSEKSLYEKSQVEKTIAFLREKDLVYDNEGACWFKAGTFGDEKDRVLIRKDGVPTYFASDIAYHKNKFDRSFSKVIDVWGADHHGYIPRMKAAVQALGHEPGRLVVLLVHMVNLLRDKVPVSMSTRAGEFVTLKEVVDEVGKDAARFIFLTRHHESGLDFDLELAKQKTNDNPVYYVQYVHARITSIMRKAEERGLMEGMGKEHAVFLKEPEEMRIIKMLARYPEVVLQSGIQMEPHRIPFYLMELASLFHAYYNRHRVLVEEKEIRFARLLLVDTIALVIRNGLHLLGVEAPEKM